MEIPHLLLVDAVMIFHDWSFSPLMSRRHGCRDKVKSCHSFRSSDGWRNFFDSNVLFNRIIKATLKIGAPSLMASGAVPRVLRQMCALIIPAGRKKGAQRHCHYNDETL